MHKDFPRSFKRILNEKQSGSEKATKPCGVSVKLIGGELKEGGVETGRRVWGCAKRQRRPYSELVIPAVPWPGFLQAQPAIPVATTITFNQPFNCRTAGLVGLCAGVCVCV